jgi:site-specific DNA-methyltransferase (adenine-specific)
MLINHIYCGDSNKLLSTIKDNVVDCVITSPPYDDLRIYNKDKKEEYDFDFKGIANQLVRVLAPGGVIVWVVGDQVKNKSETGNSFRQALYFMELGLNLHDTMIYKKNSSAFPASITGNRYSQVFEYMFVFSKGTPTTAHLLVDKPNAWAGWKGFGKMTKRERDGELVEIDRRPVADLSPRTNIWKYATGKNYSSSDDFASKHPAIFPEGLVGDHILTWTNKGDLILDPFNGSGTTTKMAKLLERRFIGIDISEEYCEIARKRLTSSPEGSEIDFSDDIDMDDVEKRWTTEAKKLYGKKKDKAFGEF